MLAIAAEANEARKRALKGVFPMIPPVAAAVELRTAVDADFAASPRISSNAARIATVLARSPCTDTMIDASFSCDGAATVAALAACVRDTAFASVCESLAAADELELDCTL